MERFSEVLLVNGVLVQVLRQTPVDFFVCLELLHCALTALGLLERLLMGHSVLFDGVSLRVHVLLRGELVAVEGVLGEDRGHVFVRDESDVLTLVCLDEVSGRLGELSSALSVLWVVLLDHDVLLRHLGFSVIIILALTGN